MVQIMTVIESTAENLPMTLKEEADREVHPMITEIEIETDDTTEAVTEIETGTIIDLDEDQEAQRLDGKGRKGRLVTGTDIVTMIGTVIGTGFSEWFYTLFF